MGGLALKDGGDGIAVPWELALPIADFLITHTSEWCVINTISTSWYLVRKNRTIQKKSSS